MTPRRKKRLTLVTLIVSAITVAVALSLLALRENINLFYSPSEVLAGEAPTGHTFRIGGLVADGTVQRAPGSLEVQFDVTDTAKSVRISYTGILPDLFREGQGIVAQGRLRPDGLFAADEVLAKHDENYMPPHVADAIKTAQGQQ